MAERCTVCKRISCTQVNNSPYTSDGFDFFIEVDGPCFLHKKGRDQARRFLIDKEAGGALSDFHSTLTKQNKKHIVNVDKLQYKLSIGVAKDHR